jgi:N-acetyl-gamma-glutamyl-phosphate/LysW-gamma-L-alpha-aminoadipyl-6-phosphate reductase
MVRVSIIGGSGYAGGEAVRLLLDHPEAELQQVTSERNAGKFVRALHPNLRKRTDLKFVSIDKLEPCDVLFVALPHGVSMGKMACLREKAPIIIDLSADFRLNDPAGYPTWYDHEHTDPGMLNDFVYGIPELHRDEIRRGDLIASGGCMATTSILGLYPLYRAGLVDLDRPVVIECKTGSSGSGGAPGLGSHHPERSGAMRSFKPTGHRHTAEIIQATGLQRVHLSITSVELVRGALATAHVFPRQPLAEKDLWRAYRAAYSGEPFVRIVRERQGAYRLPEPKILAGSNYADVGFALDEQSGRVVSICAIDNLMKGAAGTAVQCMNLMCGFDERAGLGFPGLHPV